MTPASLRIGIDARLSDGERGGVQQALIGLASGLAELDGPEEYLFLVRGGEHDWLRPHLRGRCRALELPPRPAWKRALDPIMPRWAFNAAAPLLAHVPESDGTIERAGVQVMHLALQSGFATRLPTIYTPHDLLHVHLPELIHPHERRWREAVYPELCRRAAAVTALSRWGKADLVSSLGVAPAKVHVIGWAPAIDAYSEPSGGDLENVRHRHGLPEAFALYPAQTWPHKNHLRLVEALALLRDRLGLVVPLVLTGRENESSVAIRARIRALRLEGQVRFLGFVSPLEIQALYRLARAMIFPSLFEGFGIPVVEAFRVGLPVAYATATSLPEVAGDGGLPFEPGDVSAIASALHRIWTEDELRRELAQRGRRRAAAFSWTETARKLRALYRSVGGQELTERDRDVLQELL